MTQNRTPMGVTVHAFPVGRTQVCLDWYWERWYDHPTPNRPGTHVRVILNYSGPNDQGNMTAFIAKMATYMLGTRRWRVTAPRGIQYWEVGAAGAPVPPGGGEGGENPDGILPGQEALPGLDKPSTIMMPPTAESSAVPEPKARGRRSKAVDRARP